VPGGLPILGHAWQLLTRPTAFLTTLPAHGDLVQIRLGRRTTYVACSLELVSQVLLDSRHEYDKGGPFFDNIADFFGDGLATCPNAKHPRLRRLTQPAFQRSRVAGYSDTVGREIKAALQDWRPGQILDVHRVMQGLAMRITVATMFAAWTRDGTSCTTLNDVDALVRGAFIRMAAPALAALPLPPNRRYQHAKLNLYRMIGETIDAYRADGHDRGDLLSMLLVGDGSGSHLSGTEIRDQVITMFVAGIGTTAAMLSWTLHYLSLDPRLQATVAAEAARVCQGDIAAYHDIPRLTILTRVITETLRIMPTAWLYSRVPTTPTVLGGHRLPADAPILIKPLHPPPPVRPVSPP
jgi:pentalenene oxygenase